MIGTSVSKVVGLDPSKLTQLLVKTYEIRYSDSGTGSFHKNKINALIGFKNRSYSICYTVNRTAINRRGVTIYGR